MWCIAPDHERDPRQSVPVKPIRFNGLSGAEGLSGTVSDGETPTSPEEVQAATHPLLSKKKNSAHPAQSQRIPRYRKPFRSSGTESAVRAGERTICASRS